MATGKCSSKTLASCESGKRIKSYGHLDAKSGETKPHAKTVRQETQEVKKLKKIKFAVERMETSDARIKNESKDAKLRWMHTMD